MLPPICPRNIDGASPDATEPTSSNMRRTTYTALPSTFFKSDPLPSGRSSSFNRSDQPPLDSKKTDEEPLCEFLWCSVCRYMGVKGFSPERASFYEYTWEVVACMVIIGEGRSGPNIWPETPNQGIGTEDMIYTTWYKEAMKWTKINSQQHHPLAPSAKEARYVSYTSSNYKNSDAYPAINTWFYHRISDLYDGKNSGPCWYSLLVAKQWCRVATLFIW